MACSEEVHSRCLPVYYVLPLAAAKQVVCPALMTDLLAKLKVMQPELHLLLQRLADACCCLSEASVPESAVLQAYVHLWWSACLDDLGRGHGWATAGECQGLCHWLPKCY